MIPLATVTESVHLHVTSKCSPMRISTSQRNRAYKMHTSTAGNLATIVVRERHCENPSYARQCAVRQRKPPADGLTVFRRPADGESARPGGPRPAFFENAFFENASFENAFFENLSN